MLPSVYGRIFFLIAIGIRIIACVHIYSGEVMMYCIYLHMMCMTYLEDGLPGLSLLTHRRLLLHVCILHQKHYNGVIMGAMASQITSLTIVYSTVYWPKKTSKLRVTGLCAGNSPGTGQFPAQLASNAENVSIWWRHHSVLIITAIIAAHVRVIQCVWKGKFESFTAFKVWDFQFW